VVSGSGNQAILGPLAVADVEQLALAIDVGHLEVRAFQQAQAAGVDGGQADAIDGAAHGGENPPDFVAAEHNR